LKYRFFRHLHSGNDPDAGRLYRWHIFKRSGGRIRAGLNTDQWKRSVDDYVSSATALYQSMVEEGFNPLRPIPIDPNGELLGGAHRVACAAALGIERVPVDERPNFVWAPPWHYGWFVEKGMNQQGLDRLEADWREMRGRTSD